ncbi:MAG: transglutaminase domain-containing protein [Candidatus Gracilibacteria bacterium]
MIDFRQKVINFKNKINNKIIKIKINNTKDKLNKIRVNTFVGYFSVILIGSLFISINIFNFLVCLSVNYPKLNISIYQSRNIASLKYANIIIPKSENIITPLSSKKINKMSNNSKIIYEKLKYKKTFIEKFGETLNNITVKNKKAYIDQIDDILLRVDFTTSESSFEIEIITAKMLALKEILSESLNDIDVLEEENLAFNSASISDLKNNTKEISQIPIIKEETKIEVKEIPEKPIIKKEIKTEIKKIPQAPIIKPVIKQEIKIEVKEAPQIPEIKEEIKTKIKEVTQTPVVKEEITNNIDSISANLNIEIKKILEKLNGDIFNSFKIKILKNDNFFIENGIWYTYIYTNYKNFGKGIIPSKNDLQRGGLNKKTTLLLLDNDLGASFVTDYKKVKLISDYIISGVTNKHEFLSELIDDKRYIYSDTDSLFLSLKIETENLIKGLSNGNKVSKIYEYILKNISYSTTFSINNKEIFSGIITYKNKNGICGGYTKLSLYMLSFAGIFDAKVVKGDVLDAADFPNIGHAWLKIGSLYYDPTFDDPTGATKTKTFNEYKYFGLPKDLFYTNRYDYGTLPSYLKNEDLKSREVLIQNNILKLIPKYENLNYILLKPFAFRKDNNLEYNEKITIEKLKNIIPYYEVSNYKFVEDNQIKKIGNIDYFTTDDSNIETLLEQIDYNLDGYKLFKWDNGTYRLSYNVTII